MVQLFHITVYRRAVIENATITTKIISTSDLSSYSFWTRSTIEEYMNVVVKKLVERVTQSRQSICLDDTIPITVHVFTRDELSACVVSDKEYPQRSAYSLLADLLRLAIDSPATVTPEFMRDLITTNQTPSDKLSRVQNQLDEIKEVMVQNVNQVLARGEKIDDLVDKSDELSKSAVKFRKSVPTSCCKVV